MRPKYLDRLPDRLLQVCESLEHIGVHEVAWRYPIVLEVINLSAEHGFALLGGDVYGNGLWSPIATGDSWYVNAAGLLSWSAYVEQSRRKALDYIETYHARNGENYRYTLTYVDETDYKALGMGRRSGLS